MGEFYHYHPNSVSRHNKIPLQSKISHLSLFKSQSEVTREISMILNQLLQIGNYFYHIQKYKTIQLPDIQIEKELIQILAQGPSNLIFLGYKELKYHAYYYKELSQYIDDHLLTIENEQYALLNHNRILDLLGIAATYDSATGRQELKALAKTLSEALISINSIPTFVDHTHRSLILQLCPAGTQLTERFINRSTLDSYAMCLGFSQLMKELHAKQELSGLTTVLLTQLKNRLDQLKDSPFKIDQAIDTGILLEVFPIYITMLDITYSNGDFNGLYVPPYWTSKHQKLIEQLFLCRYEYSNNQGLTFGWSDFNKKENMNICQLGPEKVLIESLPLPGSIHLVNEMINQTLLQLRAAQVGMKDVELETFYHLHQTYTGSSFDDLLFLNQQPTKNLSSSRKFHSKTINTINEMHTKQILDPLNKSSIASKLNHIRKLMSMQDPDINFIYHPATKTDLEGRYGYKKETLGASMINQFSNFLYQDSNNDLLDTYFIISDTGYCLEAALLMESHNNQKHKKQPLIISAQLALQNPDKLLPWREKKTSKQKRLEDTTHSLIKLLELLHYYPFTNGKTQHTSLILHGSSGATLSYNLQNPDITKEVIGQFGNPIFPTSKEGSYASTFSLGKDFLRRNQ